jgi:ATP-dependent Clp protease ATP-binding subunit ClpC
MSLEELTSPLDGAHGVFAVSGFGAYAILRPEAGIHQLEVPKGARSFARHAALVQVAPQPEEPAGATQGGLRAQAEWALSSSGVDSTVVRRYREQPSPLVRDSVRNWKTGRIDRVFAGDFDLI